MKRWIALALSLGILLLAGCSSSKTSDGVKLNFYYCVSSDKHYGPALQAETDSLTNASVSSVMSRLLKGPHNSELTAIIPDGTYLQSWNLQDGELKLDLSEAFGRLTGISLTRAEYSIVLTCTQLDGVETVSITVDGQSLPGGSAQSMSGDDVILKGETDDPVVISTQLYFPLSDASGLGVEYREIEVSSTDSLEQANAILQELSLGPVEEEMAGFLSGKGEMEAVQIMDQTCVVEIDRVTLESICQPEDTFLLHLYAIVDSLTELGTIEQVSFQMDGEQIEGWEAQYSAQYEF